ncbi:MAG: sulfatase-like hydrolase/transferase [Candidatus Cryptobacteroides sp.]
MNTSRSINALALVSCALAGSHVGQAQEKPNIVFILADDMGRECIGAYGSTYETPNIDTMAKQGILFTSAYSQPLSTPSRVELMTGRYNHENYVDFGFLNQDQRTFGNIARELGYKTCISGKWQLGANSALPGHFGFDNYCLWQLNYGRSKNAERYANALIEADGRILERNEDCYGPDIFLSYIENFISENKNEPFFVYWPMVLVHDPFVVTPDSPEWESGRGSRYDDNDVKYFDDMVRYCDKQVGELISFLKSNGLYDNTLIVFTGDNGTNKRVYTEMSDGSVIQGGKGLTTDAGTRVPMVALFGDRQGDPYVCDDLIDFTDFLPTFVDAMGGRRDKSMPGTSFLPQIEGRRGNPRKWVFCHYDSFFRGPDKPEKNARRFIRNHTYKLYSTGEFFNVKSDVFEENNIVSGSREDERNRRFLAKKLSRFPAWKTGDIPVKLVELPGLESHYRDYKD